MKLVVAYLHEGEAQLREFEIKAHSFRQIFLFIEELHPELWRLLQTKKLSLGALKNYAEPEKIEVWKGAGDWEELHKYEVACLIEKVEGAAIFTAAMVAAVIGSVAAVTVAGVTIGAIIAAVLNAVLMAVISMVIGMIMKALSPSPPRPETHGQSSVFSQPLNTDSEGEVIPWVLGEPVCGGIIVGKVIRTYDIPDKDLATAPTFTEDVLEITPANLPSALPSRWYKLVSETT